MMIRFFKHGQGDGRSAIDYLLAEEVPAYDSDRKLIPGEVEVRTPLPEILRGDADRTVELIDSIHRKWRYTSGVIAFALEDRPTNDELDAVMDGFERAACAGLEADQYDCLWVQHRHKGNIELHFIVPRVELYDGAAFNIAPPRSESYFNAFRDYWNTLKGWASPDDPNRRRMLRAVVESEDREEIRNAVRAHVIAKIELGKVRNHADVLAALSELTADGLEIKPPRPAKKPPKDPAEKVVMRRIGSTGTSETYRLTDRIFHEDWTIDEYLAAKNPRENRERDSGIRGPDWQRAEGLRRDLEKAIDRRTGIVRERYERSRRTHALRLANASEGGFDASERSREDHGRNAETAPALAEQGGLALYRDADGDRGVVGGGDGDPRLRDYTATDPDAGRDSAARERAGAFGEGDGYWRRGNGAGATRRGDSTALPAHDTNGSALRQNAKSGALSNGTDPNGARIAEIRQSVDRAVQRLGESNQAISRQDHGGETARHGSFGRLRDFLGRMSDAIGRLVQSISGGSGGRWFRNEGFGAGPAGTAKQAQSARVTARPSYGPSGP